jgi:hypothetical protein
MHYTLLQALKGVEEEEGDDIEVLRPPLVAVVATIR